MIYSGLVMTNEKNILYACTTDDLYVLTKYERNDEVNKWEKIQDLPRSPTDDTEIVLQLRLDKNDKILFGMYQTFTFKEGTVFGIIYFHKNIA